jgi:amino acid adenylation domain-containing protein
LSSAQQQFWFLAQLHPELPLYHEGWVVQIPGPLNVAALEQSLNEIIRRHEAWRTSFPIIDGQPVQMIRPSLTLTLPLIDLRHLPAAEREAEVQRLETEDTRRPFDLNNGPLLRAFLVRVGDNEHRLCLTFHHIIYDAFSLTEVFLPELYTLYQAFSAGQPSPLPELALQYADFAQWQQDSLQGPEQAEHLAYWKQHLAGAPTELVLPTDHPRPAVPDFAGRIEHCVLPKRLTEDLKALSLQEKASLYMTLVAALSNLLMRYTGEEDLLIGTVSAGRKRPELQSLLGVFIDILVLRTDVSGDPSFRTLLRRVREETLSAMAHDALPYTTLLKQLRPMRSLEQNSLFQVMLIVEPPQKVLPSGWRFTHLGKIYSGSTMFDLTLIFDESPEGLNGYFVYNSTVFEPATIQRMIGHWQTLLEAIVAHPDQPLSTLPLLTETERRQILVEWNATQADYPQDQCLHQLFEQQVQRNPGAVAAIYEDAQLTYQELNERANRLAHYLRKLGVGPEVLVGLCVERSLGMVVGLLAIIKAGGAYVPLDPTYPKERVAFMLSDSQVPVLLTQQRLLQHLPEHAAQVVCLDADWKTIAQESDTNPTSGAKAENLAYVIYTSGSTGKPKGVLIPHRAVVNHNRAIIKEFDLRPADRILQFATLSFDTAVEEIFPCWLVGATLVLRSAEMGLTSADLLRLIDEQRLSVLNLPTAYWHTWTYELAGSNMPFPETVRLVVVGGEQALAHRLMLWQQRVDKRVRWSNGYGPTEATITATVYNLVRDGEDQEITTVPIGRPIANTQVYVLDKHLQPVPVGVPGELYLGGAGLARGYLNRPELTAERFIPNPFSQEPGARLYKTGDLVRYRPDGNLEYIGRADFQVKIRGFRIELGEIETTLSQHPQVREAVVVAQEDAHGEKRLVAYLVLAAADAPSTSNLRSFLKEHLPDYMVPATFVVLEALPLTPSGKVDRRALPAPEESSMQRDEGYIAPRTLTEQRLAEIWEELLGQKQVGINENFFELGGHSLLAVRMLAQVNATFQVKLSLPSLFENPTLQELAASIEQLLLAEIEMMSVEELQALQKQS